MDAPAVTNPEAAASPRPIKRKVRKGTKSKRRSGSKTKRQSKAQAVEQPKSSSGISSRWLLTIGLPVVGLVGAAFLISKLLRRGQSSSRNGAAAPSAQDQKRKETVAKAVAAVPFAYTARQLVDLISVVRAAGSNDDVEDLVKQLSQAQLMHIISGVQKTGTPADFQELVQALATCGIRIMVRPTGAEGAGAAGEAGAGGAAGGAASGSAGAAEAGAGAAGAAAGGAASRGFPPGTMTMEEYMALMQQQQRAAAAARAAGGEGGGAPSHLAEGGDDADGEFLDEDGDIFDEGDFEPDDADFDPDGDDGDFDHYHA